MYLWWRNKIQLRSERTLKNQTFWFKVFLHLFSLNIKKNVLLCMINNNKTNETYSLLWSLLHVFPHVNLTRSNTLLSTTHQFECHFTAGIKINKFCSFIVLFVTLINSISSKFWLTDLHLRLPYSHLKSLDWFWKIHRYHELIDSLVQLIVEPITFH